MKKPDVNREAAEQRPSPMSPDDKRRENIRKMQQPATPDNPSTRAISNVGTLQRYPGRHRRSTLDALERRMALLEAHDVNLKNTEPNEDERKFVDHLVKGMSLIQAYENTFPLQAASMTRAQLGSAAQAVADRVSVITHLKSRSHEMVDGRENTPRLRRFIRTQYEAIAGDPNASLKERLTALDKLAKLALVRAYDTAETPSDETETDDPEAIANAIQAKLEALRRRK